MKIKLPSRELKSPRSGTLLLCSHDTGWSLAFDGTEELLQEVSQVFPKPVCSQLAYPPDLKLTSSPDSRTAGCVRSGFADRCSRARCCLADRTRCWHSAFWCVHSKSPPPATWQSHLLLRFCLSGRCALPCGGAQDELGAARARLVDGARRARRASAREQGSNLAVAANVSSNQIASLPDLFVS